MTAVSAPASPETPANRETLAYRRALAAIQARGRFGIRLGLGRTRALLHALGDPHLGLPGALIGGTNGKGSVQAMVSAVLREAGLRVGQTPKPHLVSYRERLVVGGRPIGEADFAALVGEVLAAVERVERRLGPPTEFEVLTAAAFTWFRRQGADLAIVEVGLGGRLDATNAWDGGVAAITNVERDHMDRLGETLPEIGREKAAIIKRGDRAVTGASGDGLAVIRRRARRLRVPLREVEPLPVRGMDRAGLRLDHPALGELRLGLLGRHQAANAAVALGVLEALREQGLADVSVEHVRRGLAEARWPGRLELLAVDADGRARAADRRRPDPSRPDLVLDGAHNEAGMRSLAAALDELRPLLSAGRPTLLFGLMGDKDVPAILRALDGSQALPDVRFVATAVDDPRALPAARLAAAWRELRGTGRGIEAIEPVEAALETVLEGARREGGPTIVAGSLYLVGEVRGRLLGRASRPRPDA
jgi:dihydrofolate synthase/folylpolyglutamate synthase